MGVEPALAVSIRAATSIELLVGLSALSGSRRPEAQTWLPPSLGACSPTLARRLEAVGPSSGEVWLHLLGLALEGNATTAAAFLEQVSGLEASELRRHVVGVHVPAWRTVAGAGTLEAAVEGDREAIRILLAHPRYYGGEAARALPILLELEPEETKNRLVAALTQFHREVFAAHEGELRRGLERDAAAKAAMSHLTPASLITAATHGFVYEPEPEAAHVVLAPHFAARPWLLLCQHRDTRIICYPAEEPREAEEHLEERALRLGRALSDGARIRILRRLAGGEASLAELADVTGLAKSTAHHHLTQLRAAGLVTVSGNARAYRYSLRADGVDEISGLVAGLVSAPQEG